MLTSYETEHVTDNFGKPSMFVPAEKGMAVIDPQTGVSIKRIDTNEITQPLFRIQFPDGRKTSMGVILEKKISGQENFNKADNPSIKVLLGDLECLARFRAGKREDNTKFVRYILSGLSALNRRWPIYSNSIFYSDRDSYERKGIDLAEKLSFDPPSEEEIRKL